MNSIIDKIKKQFPEWVQKKQRRPRPTATERRRNARKSNAHIVKMQEQWHPIPEA